LVEANRALATAGSPLLVPLGGSGGGEVEVLRPTGEVLRVKNDAGPGQPVRYADTHDVGVYVVRSGDPQAPKQFALAVNPDPDHSDPATLTAQELKDRVGGLPVHLCDNPEEMAGAIQKLREGKSLWEVFLWAVLIGLVAEAFVANRSDPRAEATGPKPGAAKVGV
jgi:hypothetical protein